MKKPIKKPKQETKAQVMMKRRQANLAIRYAWSSLESHLEYAMIDVKNPHYALGDRRHHVMAIREYAFIILTLSNTL